jgi:hypothetical protein
LAHIRSAALLCTAADICTCNPTTCVSLAANLWHVVHVSTSPVTAVVRLIKLTQICSGVAMQGFDAAQVPPVCSSRLSCCKSLSTIVVMCLQSSALSHWNCRLQRNSVLLRAATTTTRVVERNARGRGNNSDRSKNCH